jgi:class 3 adenylate cyclase/tetratricopeptide (TPR) repeat protein
MPRPPSRASHQRAPTATRAFLFSDLRGYTDFVEAHGDAAAAELLRNYRTLVRGEVARHRGAEVKTEGDSFYVVFESPSAALDCAVAILRKARAKSGTDTKHVLRIGIGLHAGETIAYDRQFVGSTVNVASRLASTAEAGELLISDTLRGLVRTGRNYPMSVRGPLTLKGVSEPIHAWSVSVDEGAVAPRVTPPPAPVPPVARAAGQILCPVVIGRDAELAQVEAAIGTAVAGHGQTIVVAGEAGGGKSAFVREAVARAHARGFRVLTGATLESERTLPYAPFIAGVRAGFRGSARDQLGRFLAQTAPDLAQLFPELGPAPGPDRTAPLEPHRLAVAFLGLLTAFARDGPILLVLEDLHWSDEASLDLLHYLARELRDSRSLLLATYRSDEMHRRHPFLRTLGALQRERLVIEIALGRLTPDEIASLIHESLQMSDPLSAEFRDAIYARSGGNPFFTEELLRALVESGDLFRTETGWDRKPIAQLRIPASIREAVHARIEPLPVDAQATLSAAAVIGLRFPFEVLLMTSGATAPDVLAHLRQFIEGQLVVEEGGEDDVYAFRHALTREVVYDELLAPERKALHRAVATLLEGRSSSEPGLIALHLVASGDPQRAVPHILEAARRAMAADAPREAASQYEHALEIGVPDQALATTTEGLARAYLRFDTHRGRRTAELCVSLYRKANDPRGTSRMLLLVANAAALQADPRREAIAEEAMDVVEGMGDTLELAHALIRLGRLYWARGAVSKLRDFADRAFALGQRLNDPLTLAEALYLSGLVLQDEKPDEARRLVAQGREIAIQAGFAESAVNGYMLDSWLPSTGRPRQELIALIEEGLAYAKRHGIEQTNLTSTRAYVHLNHGEWDEALASAERIDRDSASYDNALEIRARIAEGRDGPEAAMQLYLEHANRWRAFAGTTTPRVPVSTAYAALLGGNRVEAEAALNELRSLGDTAVLLAQTEGGSRLLLCATLLNQPEWIDMVEAVFRAGAWKAMQASALACRAGRAFLASDATECGRLMSAARELDPPPAAFGLDTARVECVVAWTRELRRNGRSIGGEWGRALGDARAFAEKAKATWWLGELGQAE